MCTVVILRRPDHDWPLIIGANRDEMRDRPARPPAHHWDDRDHVVAGMDELAGGTWLALNDDRLVAAVLNRYGSLGPDATKRSRGELPLEAVDHAEAKQAAKALALLEPESYRTFNMVIADTLDAFWVRSDGKRVEALEIPPRLVDDHRQRSQRHRRLGPHRVFIWTAFAGRRRPIRAWVIGTPGKRCWRRATRHRAPGRAAPCAWEQTPVSAPYRHR